MTVEEGWPARRRDRCRCRNHLFRVREKPSTTVKGGDMGNGKNRPASCLLRGYDGTAIGFDLTNGH